MGCYAERVAARFSGPGQPYEGLAERSARRWKDGALKSEFGPARWTGVVRLVPEHLDDPVRWQRPRRIFVNSMSDLFHEKLSNEDIAAVFGVMAAAPRHVFQVLTKRPERMRALFSLIHTARVTKWGHFAGCPLPDIGWLYGRVWQHWSQGVPTRFGKAWNTGPLPWPIPNVWLGVSCEDQHTADERIPLLLDTPAAVRWVSVEPQLGPVSLHPFLRPMLPGVGVRAAVGLDWVVVGGESGPRARHFDPEWPRILVAECRAAGVPVFVKQMGELWARDNGAKSRHGVDPAEWPADLRVQEFPR